MQITFKDIKSPFDALRTQLKDSQPGKSPIDMTIGSPKHKPPTWIKDRFDEAMHTVGNYPLIKGTEELTDAIINWTQNRFKTTKGHINSENCLPLNGSREGLFYACICAKARKTDIENPIVLLPNPFYQVYSAAAIANGAHPYLLNSTAETGFLPDLGKIPESILQRTIAFYICTPSNPEGAIASQDYLIDAVKLARTYDFLLFSDECYSELYNDQPPTSALEAAIAENGTLENVCAFNSLSKRSNVPGLRSGCIVGDSKFMSDFTNFRNVAAPQVPGPVQHVSAHLWADETHVIENRKLYQEKFDFAEKLLVNHFSMQKPAAGMFLWLNFSQFGGGISAVTTLWKDCGVKLLPGAYLSGLDHNGINPGEDYARMALVGSLEQTNEALQRILSRFE